MSTVAPVGPEVVLLGRDVGTWKMVTRRKWNNFTDPDKVGVNLSARPVPAAMTLPQLPPQIPFDDSNWKRNPRSDAIPGISINQSAKGDDGSGGKTKMTMRTMITPFSLCHPEVGSLVLVGRWTIMDGLRQCGSQLAQSSSLKTTRRIGNPIIWMPNQSPPVL